jgi:hypothetical protein
MYVIALEALSIAMLIWKWWNEAEIWNTI